ncbi:hypothetical protein EDF75_2037 [Raoultella sp. BIGb0149]|uniref:hypothetical protein n=1 Tax=Raoultella sp. BIGb0149 TaxID=2485116 RepID=UPI00106067E7|nr:MULTISPECIES: hypothetical protein [Raoultella]TDQ24916.1 hypothetical protein EDF75_2037 [Raoultella sp. BIGb0149]HDT6086133.1 hypothetical protein [Raoultella ornithinolytica]
MRALTKEEVKIISGGGVDREAVVAVGNIAGGLLGNFSRVPNGGLYGSTAGSYIAGKGYDAIANSPTITIPNININPITQGIPSYISRPGMHSSIYTNAN